MPFKSICLAPFPTLYLLSQVPYQCFRFSHRHHSYLEILYMIMYEKYSVLMNLDPAKVTECDGIVSP